MSKDSLFYFIIILLLFIKNYFSNKFLDHLQIQFRVWFNLLIWQFVIFFTLILATEMELLKIKTSSNLKLKH